MLWRWSPKVTLAADAQKQQQQGAHLKEVGRAHAQPAEDARVKHAFELSLVSHSQTHPQCCGAGAQK